MTPKPTFPATRAGAKILELSFSALPLLALLTIAPSAWGWGCKGHEIVALIAEKHLTPQARKMADQILAAGPIGNKLRHYCTETGLDTFADSATWADDERNARTETGPWHYIDIPLGKRKGSLAPYCPPSTSCITEALAAQLAILRAAPGAVTDQARGDALRFVIHFLGDIHQPLHAANNNDAGGNCLPVAFFDRTPKETNQQLENYRPDLHAVWDTDILIHFTSGRTVQQIAADFDAKFSAQIPGWQSGKLDATAWAWESQRAAREISYGKLQTKVPIEKPQPIVAEPPSNADVDCTRDNHVSARLLKLNEQIGDAYIAAAQPVVETRLTQAGVRLAAVLNALWL